MNQRLLDAYLEFSGERARAGIIDDSLTDDLHDDRPLEERIADILRAAGRLPEGWPMAAPPPTPPHRLPPRKRVSGEQRAPVREEPV